MRELLRRFAASGVVALLATAAAPAYAAAGSAGPHLAGKHLSAPARPARASRHGTHSPTPLTPLLAAMAQARSANRPVTVPAETTPTSVTVARPDGKFVTATNALPVRVRRGTGWVPVSATLRRVAGGYSPAATPSALVLSAGGRGPLATLTDSSGGLVSFAFAFPLPAPAVAGSTATYRSVLPGVDLDVTASDQGGFSEILVIRNARAAASPALATLRLATATRGLSVHADAAGNLSVTAPDGKVEFAGPPPRMWDSATTTGHPGDPAAHVLPVRMRAAGGSLLLVPDRRMLTAPGTKYPVYVDPSVNPASSGTSGYVEVQQGCPSFTNYNDSDITQEGIGDQNYGQPCGGIYRSFYQLNTGNLSSAMVVSKATLLTAEMYDADETCSHTWPVTLKWTGSINSGTDWGNQPGVLSTLQTMNPKSAWCGTQDVNFDVTKVMQTTAANNDKQWTFGLYGDESNLPSSACSPSASHNCGYMRFNDNPSVTTVYDLHPSVPSNLETTPQSHDDGAVVGPDCGTGTGTVGWLGKTDLGSGTDSSVTLNAEVSSNIVGEHIRAQYTLRDETDGEVVSSPVSPYLASPATTDTLVGVQLQDGHEYDWDVVGYDGTLAGTASATCYFKVDLAAPAQPSVSSAAFPVNGSNPPSPPVVGTTGTFTFSSTDPAPNGCSSCVASGVASYEYSFNTPLATTGNPTVPAGTPVTYTASQWGTNILYVAAVDNAGNVSQAEQYAFWVQPATGTSAFPGDVDGDGTSDLLTSGSNGDLLLYRGGTDPAVTPAIAGTTAGSPDGTSGWGAFQVTHRGSMTGNNVDDLFVHKGAYLWLYPNNPTNPGKAPQFGDNTTMTSITKPSCGPTASNQDNCASYAAGDWSDVGQIVAPGDAFAALPGDNGKPSLLTVENDQLWLYRANNADGVNTPILLGSSGWGGMTVIAPGVVGGQLTLWARDIGNGTVYSWPITLDANGVPELGTSSTGAPVTATSGSVIAGITLPATSYPVVVSSGPLISGACTAGSTACPGLYAEDAAGNLWYLPGQPVTGGAAALEGGSSAILIGRFGASPGTVPGCGHAPPCPATSGPAHVVPLS